MTCDSPICHLFLSLAVSAAWLLLKHSSELPTAPDAVGGVALFPAQHVL